MPFKIEREWEHLGLKCAVSQGREGRHRCGYVRVPPTHPLFGKSHQDLDEVCVHGGLSFAEIEPCEHEDGAGWWFGFDCSHPHLGDLMYDPAFDAVADYHRAEQKLTHILCFGREPHFWTQAEVEQETERLAEQLAG